MSDDPAFPVANNILTYSQGLTKREYFAAVCLQAIVDASGYNAMSEAACKDNAEKAVRQADALIAELSRKPKR